MSSQILKQLGEIYRDFKVPSIETESCEIPSAITFLSNLVTTFAAGLTIVTHSTLDRSCIFDLLGLRFQISI